CTVTDRPKDDDQNQELVLDWDDAAVESFRMDIESSARAEAAPFPQRSESDRALPALPEPREERPTLMPRRTEASLLPAPVPRARPDPPPPPDAQPQEGPGQRALPFRPSLPSSGLNTGRPSFSSTLAGLPPLAPPAGLKPAPGLPERKSAPNLPE